MSSIRNTVVTYWFSILALCIAQFAAGCATFRPTPYQPSVDGGYGYRDERIGIGEYRITVSGNDETSADILQNQLLYRAADITMERGHGYFVVAPNAAGQLVYIKPAFLMPQFGTGAGAQLGVRTPILRYYDQNYGYSGGAYAYPVGVEPSRRLIASATISFVGRKQAGAKKVFDAKEVINRLKPQIVFPTPIAPQDFHLSRVWR